MRNKRVEHDNANTPSIATLIFSTCKSNDPHVQRKYKMFAIAIVSIIFLVFCLYGNGNLSLSSSKSSSKSYRKSSSPLKSAGGILSSWGDQQEALKFANLPSSGQGFLTVKAMVENSGTNSKKMQDIQIFYREASKLNPVGFGLKHTLEKHLPHMMKKHISKMMQMAKPGKDQNMFALPDFTGLRNDDSQEKDNDIVMDKDVTLILLHGPNYASSTWEELGTMNFFAQNGYKVYAFDMPSHGHSEKIAEGHRIVGNDWLIDVITKLVLTQDEEGNIDEDGGEHKHHHLNNHQEVMQDDMKNIAIISPGISGRYTMDLLMNNIEHLKEKSNIKLVKFVPVSLTEYSDFMNDNEMDLSDTNVNLKDVSICCIGGDKDDEFHESIRLFEQMPNTQVAKMNDASNQVYLDHPDTFHDILLRFLEHNDCSYPPKQA